MTHEQNIYAIHDEKAEAFLAPFFMANDLMAIRAFTALVNEEGHLFHNDPSDFTLFCLGSYHQGYGTITADSAPRAIRNGVALVSKVPKNGQTDMFEERQTITKEINTNA